MDVKSALLNGYIEEEVYVRQRPCIENANRVYKLRKALYGLKQTPRAWYARLKSFLLKSGFVMGSVDKTLFFLSWLTSVLNGDQNRHLASPRTSHRQGVKHIFRYLKVTPELGLWYSSGSSLSLRGFSNVDYAGCRIDRKSTSGTCQFLGTSLVSWSSRKQASVSLSTTEAEYISAASCCSQLLWMKATLSDFGLSFGRIPFLVDSTSAISIAKNPVLHSRTKHIDVRFQFLRDHYEKGDIDLIHVETQNQLADILTQPLEFSAFSRLRGIDNALIKGEIENQWTGLIILLV
ncbi:LOW QUALITY PROTEIN: hypothetical protein U9M48_003531 [Paspalum notatum var. saurae]|uniref:Reverse transcriptase Ty1/copia-type domain-containing protein n=1 Tax=Paspalum notatum var. saurae TaxID=547442 RepID=A0AAQ3PT35_PASNO